MGTGFVCENTSNAYARGSKALFSLGIYSISTDFTVVSTTSLVAFSLSRVIILKIIIKYSISERGVRVLVMNEK
jgi:hypothetical protein